MPTAAWCHECNANVWVSADGACSNGHPRSCLRGLYEANPAPSTAAPLSVAAALPVTQTAGFEMSANEQIAKGLNTIVCGVGVHLLAVALRAASSALGDFGALIALGALLANLIGSITLLVGVFRLTRALDYTLGDRILYFVFMFLPVLNLLALLRLTSNASESLKESGYKVGLLGARL